MKFLIVDPLQQRTRLLSTTCDLCW